MAIPRTLDVQQKKTLEIISRTIPSPPHDDDDQDLGVHNHSQDTYSYDAPDSSVYGGDQSPTHCPSAPPAQGVKETESLLRGESSAALIELIQRTEGAERRVRGSEKFKYLGADDEALHVRYGTTTTVYGSRGGETARYNHDWVLSLAKADHRQDEAAVREEYDDDYDDDDGPEAEDWKDGGGGCECGFGGHDEEDEKLEEERDEAKEVIRPDHSQHRSWAVDESSRSCGQEREDGANAVRHSSLTAMGEGMEMTLVDYSSEETSTAEEDPSDGEGSRTRLPSLYFEDLRSMVEDAGVPDPMVSGADVVDETGDDQTKEAELSSTPDREVLFDFSEYTTAEVQNQGCELSIGDLLDSFSEEFEGWQTDADEEENLLPTPAHEIVRPVAGLGWYDDNERSNYSDIRPHALVMSISRADEESNTASDRSPTFPLRKDSLEHSPRALAFSEPSYAAEKGDNFTTMEADNFGGTPMRTVFDNTSQFFQSTTVEDEHWISTLQSPKSPRRSSSIYSEDSSENEDSLSPASKISPTSPSEGKEDEEEIDDLLDIYATTSNSHHDSALSPQPTNTSFPLTTPPPRPP
ncbi:uncharacterized protein N0V96_002043 [Colletotrichum fioriniae]|uniref:uncharacterized protein n=1 Tax=Colletotrichum fioriniae TaxID=710243 RepID=UPI0032DB52E0|nr:hypothetical protein N0V96_002043 [Colletotrichum fioriniae]